MVPVKLSTPPSKSSPGKKRLSGILKNIDSDVFSTPILESRTRKEIMQISEKTSGTFMKGSIPSGQDEKEIFINSIKTLQAKVNGNQFISVTVIPPKNSKGKKKIWTKDADGVDINIPPIASVSRKHDSEVLQIQGKYS
jgi:hypothetical protein